MGSMRVGTIGIVLLLAAGSILFCAAQNSRQPAGEVFPMRKGTHWTYRGEVAWQVTGEGAKVHRSRLDWNMDVIDSMQRGPYKAALITGLPRDLTFYEEGRKPGCNVLIGEEDKKFYLAPCAQTASRRNLTLTEKDVSSMINEDNLILRLPLARGDTFGGDAERAAKDGMYAWYVQEIKRARLKGIAGVSGAIPWTEYVLTFRTNPDHEIVTYAPGIGLTSYVYGHHGTVSEVNLKLVEFHLPDEK
jgi:hypothetical protein